MYIFEGEHTSIDINFAGEIPDNEIASGSHFRSIQTDNPNLAKKLIKDIKQLINKYDHLGCHIGR